MHEVVVHQSNQLSTSIISQCSEELYLWGISRHPLEGLALVLVSDSTVLQRGPEHRHDDHLMRTGSYMWIDLTQLPGLLVWLHKRNTLGYAKKFYSNGSALHSHQLGQVPAKPLLRSRGTCRCADFIGHAFQLEVCATDRSVECEKPHCALGDRAHCHWKQLVSLLESSPIECPDITFT